jgi:hypothetical protein
MAKFKYLGNRDAWTFIGFSGWKSVKPGDVIEVSDTDEVVREGRVCSRQQWNGFGDEVPGGQCDHPDHPEKLPVQTEADCYRAASETWAEVKPSKKDAKEGEAA